VKFRDKTTTASGGSNRSTIKLRPCPFVLRSYGLASHARTGIDMGHLTCQPDPANGQRTRSCTTRFWADYRDDIDAKFQAWLAHKRLARSEEATLGPPPTLRYPLCHFPNFSAKPNPMGPILERHSRRGRTTHLKQTGPVLAATARR